MLKKFFPASWMSSNIVGFVVSLLIYAVLGFLFGKLSSIITWPVFRVFAQWIFYTVLVYCFIGAVASVVIFIKSKSEKK